MWPTVKSLVCRHTTLYQKSDSDELDGRPLIGVLVSLLFRADEAKIAQYRRYTDGTFRSNAEAIFDCRIDFYQV